MPKKNLPDGRAMVAASHTNLPVRFAIADTEIRPEQLHVIEDRRPLGPGPWSDEPADKIAWRDAPTGLDCILLRQPSGVWAGFVGVEPSHPLYCFHADVIPPHAGLSPHGGVDYAQPCSQDGPEALRVCHVRHTSNVGPSGSVPDTWWFGFAADKPGDLIPDGPKPPLALEEGETYRDLDYMYRETTKLARQLSELEGRPSVDTTSLPGRTAPRLGRS